MASHSRVFALLATIGCVSPAPDFQGNYELTYDDQFILKLDVAGVVRERRVSGSATVVDFGEWDGHPLTLDLKAFCDRPDVACPSEAFWARVAIQQPNLDSRRLDSWVINVVNDTQHILPVGERAEVVAGFVTKEASRFLVGLGASGAAGANCGLLALSAATGRFTRVGEQAETTTVLETPDGKPCPTPDAGSSCVSRDVTKVTFPVGAAFDGIAEGKVATLYLGGCAFGAFLVGATLTIETGFTGRRTGDVDPPPFTPLAPDPELGADAGMP